MVKILRSIKVEDDLWLPAMEKANREGRTLSDVIRQALRKYIGKGE